MKITEEKVRLVEKITHIYYDDLKILRPVDLAFWFSDIASQLSRKQLRDDYNYLKGEIK